MIQVLTVLGKGALLGTLELLDELCNYQKSYKKAHQGFYGGAELQVFYSLLTRLKNQGLIEKLENSKGTLWKITTAGFNRFTLIKDKKALYDIESDGKLKIIAYDIPEKERSKRLWLREVLKMMNFKMLQKSLAVGKSKIPENFLEDLRKRRMLSYVHIFEVTKTGTIKELS